MFVGPHARACVSFVVAPSPLRSKAMSLTEQAGDSLHHHGEVGQVSHEASRRDLIGHRPQRAAMYCLGPQYWVAEEWEIMALAPMLTGRERFMRGVRARLPPLLKQGLRGTSFVSEAATLSGRQALVSWGVCSLLFVIPCMRLW